MDMTSSNSPHKLLCEQIMQGVNAAASLQQEYRIPLERYLVSRCDRNDGRSREKAVEIASQILTECFTRSPSLLERWRGEGTLESFLRTSAYNRLRSWWQSAEKRTTEVDSESRALELHVAAPCVDVSSDELEIAVRAMAAGVDAATRACPEGLVFLRLKGLHGVDQRLIANAWGHHESQTSRRIREAMELIRTTANERAEREGCALDSNLLQYALQRNPAMLLGAGGHMPDSSEILCLRELAAGGSTASVRSKAVVLMCNNPQALEFFACLLNQVESSKPAIPMDPDMAGIATRLHGMLARSLANLNPADVRGLMTPLMRESFADILRAIGADGGTLWYSCPNEAVLEAVFNPFEAEITGKRQPLVSGIISLTLATGGAFLCNDTSGNHHHSPAIDIALGTSTRSMIAVPFKPAGETRGVITAVSLSPGMVFSDVDKQLMERHSKVQSELLLASMTSFLRG